MSGGYDSYATNEQRHKCRPAWREVLKQVLARVRLVGNLKDRSSSSPRQQNATQCSEDTDVPRCLGPVLGLKTMHRVILLGLFGAGRRAEARWLSGKGGAPLLRRRGRGLFNGAGAWGAGAGRRRGRDVPRKFASQLATWSMKIFNSQQLP